MRGSFSTGAFIRPSLPERPTLPRRHRGQGRRQRPRAVVCHSAPSRRRNSENRFLATLDMGNFEMELRIRTAVVLLLLAATLELASPEQAAIISMVSNAESKMMTFSDNDSSRATPPPSTTTMASSTTTESTTTFPQQPVARDLWSQ